MIIHVIQPGETAYSIAADYGVSAEWLIRENGVAVPEEPVVGNTYVILFPEQTYTIQEGDTLESIANAFNVTVLDLLRNNTYLADQEYLIVGDTLVIRYTDSKIGPIVVNSYAYPFIDINTLKKTLPFLTFLTVYGYNITSEQDLDDIEDTTILQMSKAYRVAPLMHLRFIDMSTPEGTDNKLQILTDMAVQNQFIERIIAKLESKGYMGLNFDTPYIFPAYRQNYIQFINNLAGKLKERGLLIFNTLSPSSYELLSSFLFSGQDVVGLSQVVDGTILLNYGFGFTYDAPTDITGFCTVEQVIQSIITYIPPEEVQLGIPTIGYRWELPYIPTVTKGNAISNTRGVQIARENDIAIQFDNISQTAYFGYEEFEREYFIRYKDARSMDAFLQLANQNNIPAIAVWNIMEYFYDLWLIVNSLYEIVKII